MSKTKVSKNAFRRQQKKLKKEVCARHLSTHTCIAQAADHNTQETPAPAVSEPAAEAVEPEDGANDRPAAAAAADAASVTDAIDVDAEFDFADLPEFRKVFQRFQEPRQDAAGGARQQEKEQVIWEEDNDNIPDEEAENAAPRKSKKQRKRENKLSVAELKAMARKPELVEWTDADSSDPRLLLSIKSHRNVVPVPAHWSLKREVRCHFPFPVLCRADSRTVSIIQTWYRKARIPSSQVHRRHGHSRNARRRSGEAGRADTEAEAARTSTAQDG